MAPRKFSDRLTCTKTFDKTVVAAAYKRFREPWEMPSEKQIKSTPMRDQHRSRIRPVKRFVFPFFFLKIPSDFPFFFFFDDNTKRSRRISDNSITVNNVPHTLAGCLIKRRRIIITLRRVYATKMASTLLFAFDNSSLLIYMNLHYARI